MLVRAICLVGSLAVGMFDDDAAREPLPSSPVNPASGSTVTLTCNISSPSFDPFNNPVVWVKVQDAERLEMNLMKVILEPFQAEGRFEIAFRGNFTLDRGVYFYWSYGARGDPPVDDSYEIILVIKDVRPEDNGRYECEIQGKKSSKLLRVAYVLRVQEPVVSIRLSSSSQPSNAETSGYEPEPMAESESDNTDVDDPRTAPPSSRQEDTTVRAGELFSLACTSRGGYPEPDLALAMGDHDITGRFSLSDRWITAGAFGFRRKILIRSLQSNSVLVGADEHGMLLVCTAGRRTDDDDGGDGGARLSVSSRMVVLHGPSIECQDPKLLLAYKSSKTAASNVRQTRGKACVSCDVKSWPLASSIHWEYDSNRTRLNGLFDGMFEVIGPSTQDAKDKLKTSVCWRYVLNEGGNGDGDFKRVSTGSWQRLPALKLVASNDVGHSERDVVLLDDSHDILIGTIAINTPSREDCYYGVKLFLKFEDKTGSLPCVVARGCLGPDVVDSELVVTKWNFVRHGKRKNLDVAFLEISEVLILSERASPDSNAKGPTPVIEGRVLAVSEVVGIPGSQGEGFLVLLEGSTVISCGVKESFWLQGWLEIGRSYAFENVSQADPWSREPPVWCYKAEEGFSISPKTDVPLGKVSNPDWETVEGVVTRAAYSHFGRFVVDFDLDVYMHDSGSGNFEHVRPGCRVVLENVCRAPGGSVVGGPMSRLSIVSWLPDESDHPLDEFGLDRDGFKPFGLLSQLIESSEHVGPQQLDNLIRDVSSPIVKLCPGLVTTLGHKAYGDLFATALRKSPGRDRGSFEGSELASVPLARVRPQRKAEDFVCGHRDRTSDKKLVKLLTVRELLDESLDGGRFSMLERSGEDWECRVVDSGRFDEPFFVVGMLKRDDRRACLSLVDSEDSIECVVTVVGGNGVSHSCRSAPTCRLLSLLSPTPAQMAGCPYAQPSFADCLVRIDRFVLVSETFSSPAGKTEKRYLVFSGEDVALFGPDVLVEMGLTYFPCWPSSADVASYERSNFAPSEWSHFSLVPTPEFGSDRASTSRFEYECFVLKSFLAGCRDFSFDGFSRFVEEGAEGEDDASCCRCRTSFSFVVLRRDWPVAAVRRSAADGGNIGMAELLEKYTKATDAENPTSDDDDDDGGRESWDSRVPRLFPLAQTTRPRDAGFVGGEHCYRFVLGVALFDLADEECRRCQRSGERSNGRLGLASTEALLVFSDGAAGWYPFVRQGCVYELEVTGESCRPLRRQFVPRSCRTSDSVDWKCIVEVPSNSQIRRSYRDWSGICSGGQPLTGAEGRAAEVYRRFSQLLEIDAAARRASGDFETLMGTVVAKKFRRPVDGDGDHHHQPPPGHRAFGTTDHSLPGIQSVTVTLRLLGSEEKVKVSIPADANYKYALGVVGSTCVRFARVQRTDFRGCLGASQWTLYKFVSVSDLEVLSFPDELPEDPADVSLRPDSAPGRRSARPEGEDEGAADGPNDPRASAMLSIDSATLFEFSGRQGRREGEDCPSQVAVPVAAAPNVERRFLRELLYDSVGAEIVTDVYLEAVSSVDVYLACRRHPDEGTDGRAAPLCRSCDGAPTLFRAKLKARVCDSTLRAYATLRDDMARRILCLTVDCWLELEELVAKCPRKRVCWSFSEEGRGGAADGDGLAADVKTFLSAMANSETVRRRLIVRAERFRTILNQDGLKSFDIASGPRPLGATSDSRGADFTGLRERTNACRSYVSSLATVPRDAEGYLPVVNLEVREIAEVR